MEVQCACCKRRADVAWKRVPLCGDHGLEVARRLATNVLREATAEDIARLTQEIAGERDVAVEGGLR